MKAQYPARIDDFEVRFWRYNLKDLARIGVPTLLGFSATQDSIDIGRFMPTPGLDIDLPRVIPRLDIDVPLNLPGLGFDVPPGMLFLAAGIATGVGLAEIKRNGKNFDRIAADYLGSYLEEMTLNATGGIRDEVVVLDDGTVLGLVEVQSVDLDMASDIEWRVNRDTVFDLYKEIDYPINLHSRKRTVDLSEYRCDSDQAVVTDHYIAVTEVPKPDSLLPWKTTESTSIDERIDTVVTRCTNIRNTLNEGDLSADRVTGDDLREAVQRFSYPDLSLERRRYSIGSAEKKCRRLLYIQEYPEQLKPGLLSDVLNLDTPGFVDIVQSVKPVSEKQRKKLQRLTSRLKVEGALTPDPIRRSGIDRKLRDAEDMIEAEASGDERLVNHAAYIVVSGKSWSEVDETVDDVTRLLRRKRIEYEEPWLETPQAIQTDSPFRRDALDKQMILPSRSAASSFAFSTHDKIEDGGIVIGIDTRNGLPVILDRYSWEAGDIARMGKKGSGKSYSAKMTLLRMINQYNNLQVHILDPKQEYGRIIDAVDGLHVILDRVDIKQLDIGANVVRYTVEDRSRDNTKLLTEAMQYIYRVVSQDASRKIVLVDEAWHLLNDPEGRQVIGKLVREGRDVNACVELVTQNASDFTRSQEGRDILKNLNGYLFFKHQDVNTGVRSFFNLSSKEAGDLRKLPTGNKAPFSKAIINGPVNTKLQIESSLQEHAIIEGGGS